MIFGNSFISYSIMVSMKDMFARLYMIRQLDIYIYMYIINLEMHEHVLRALHKVRLRPCGSSYGMWKSVRGHELQSTSMRPISPPDQVLRFHGSSGYHRNKWRNEFASKIG